MNKMRKFKFISFFLLILLPAFVFSQTHKKESKANIPDIWPVKGIVDKYFGSFIDTATGEERFNNGIYICTKEGEKVRATAEGYVKNIKKSKDGNYMVVVDHGNSYITRYGNLSQVDVKEKEYLKMGENIGVVGKTADEKMPFLYFEIQFENKPVDPFDYIMK